MIYRIEPRLARARAAGASLFPECVMRTRLGVALALSLCLAIALLAQSAGQPSTPSACLKATRDFQSARLKEAGAPVTAEKYAVVQKDKIDFARGCLATIALDTVPGAELIPLVNLYVEAAQPDLADATIARALTAAGPDVALRASVLVQAVGITMRQPKSDARNQKAEQQVAEIEKLPDTIVKERIQAHGSLNSYYRADDIDEGIIRHSARIIELNKKLSPSDRVGPLANTLIAAFEDLAEALAGNAQSAEALTVLRRAAPELAGVAGVADRVAPVIERYELVGKPGAAIEAPRWLNSDRKTTRVEMPGSVTWLQFTAHWCGPCRKSYPAIARMAQRFGGKGFRVVMATQLYGYFESQRNLGPDAECAAITDYFPAHEIVFPVAVSDNIPPGNKPVRQMNVNDANYKVSGIPQIQILDKKGVVRLIIVGWDQSNEARYAAFIAKLIAE